MAAHGLQGRRWPAWSERGATLQTGMDASTVNVNGYEMLRVAGRGGMGVVYEARRDDGQRVALKVIAPEHTDDPEFERRFAREAKLAAQITHPHIVEVIDSGHTADGRPYVAFAFIDGTDLDHRLHQRGALDAAQVARIVGQIAGALDAAHRAGFVHRDVKPANVLLDQAGSAYLADFGLTRPLTGTRFTRSGAWLGTVDYAAPEQIQGHQVDARADIYALAAMTFQMLAGTVPFPRDSDMAKLWAHVNEDRPRLPATVEHRAVLQAVIDRGMARDAGERYLSAGDFGAALAGAAAGRTARIEEHMARPVPRRRQLPRPPRSQTQPPRRPLDSRMMLPRRPSDSTTDQLAPGIGGPSDSSARSHLWESLA